VSLSGSSTPPRIILRIIKYIDKSSYRSARPMIKQIGDIVTRPRKKVHGLTFQSSAAEAVRGSFKSKGKLANTKDTKFRPINKNFPVFAFSVDLGSVAHPVSTLFTLDLMQEQAIRSKSQNGIIILNSLWASYFMN
jgi:hypothetical protein